MKIIITENKLHKLQTDVLNNLIGYNVSQFDNFILIYYPNDYNGDYDYAEVLMEYDYEDSRLYVDHSFLKNFAKFENGLYNNTTFGFLSRFNRTICYSNFREFTHLGD